MVYTSASLASFARAHIVQKELCESWVLTADIDEGSPEMVFVIGGVEADLGELHMLVFSSSSVRYGNKNGVYNSRLTFRLEVLNELPLSQYFLIYERKKT